MCLESDDLMQRAAQARQKDQLDEAHRLVSLALQAARDSDDQRSQVRALGMLGHLHLDRDELDLARTTFHCAESLAREIDDPLLVAYAIRHLGDVISADGKLEDARALVIEAIELYRDYAGSDALPLANALRSLALLHERQHHEDDASESWREARAIYAIHQIAEGVAECDEHLARRD